VKTPIGYVPDPKDIDMTGLEMPNGSMDKLFAITRKDWLAEVDAVGQFFDGFGTRMPDEMWRQHELLRARLLAK
jgi:phosphoenolpyruvate carboxykinase (GTP)